MRTHFILKSITASIVVLLISVQAFATDYYCDPKGGNIKNNGSKDNPWGKLEDVFKSSKTFVAGDQIFLMSGNHGEVSIVGVNKKYVKIIGLDGASVSSFSFGNATTLAQKWSVSDLSISSNDLAVYVSSNSSRIKFSEVKISSSKSFLDISKDEIEKNNVLGFLIEGSNCKVENSTISNIGIAIKNTGNKNLFRNIVVTNFSKRAIETSGSNNTFENNLIAESFQVSSTSNTGIMLVGKEGSVVKNNIFRANYILNFKRYNRKYIGQLDGIVSRVDIENSIFENNVVITNSSKGIALPLIHNSKIVNNTIVNPYFGIVLKEEKNINASIIIGDDTKAESVNIIVRNNIANDFTFANVKGIEDHNINLDVNVKEYDNNFFSWAKYDFSLIESSVALNKGTFEGAPKTDANLVSRKIGNFINIGAYEYGKIDESNQDLIVIVDPRDRELRSKGKDDWDGQPQIRVGGSGQDFDGVAVFPFQLPLLPGGKQIVEADFSAYMIKIDNRPNGNLDVYGLPFVQKDKFWVISHDAFYQGDYGQDITARPIQSSIADGTSITGTTRLNSVGKIGLKGYLNTSYEAGAQTGDFVFIRLNPSVKDVTPFHRWIFQSGNTEKNKHKAKLYLTVGYPELNKEGVVFNELDETVVLTSNIIEEGKVNVRFYGFGQGKPVKLKLFTYSGELVLEKEFSAEQVSSTFAESVNENKIETGKYILEIESDSVAKKQSVLIW